LEQRIKQAEQEGKDQVLIPNANTEVSLDDAKKLFNSLSDSNRKESIETLEEPTVNLQKKKKDTLLIANNIDKAEFTKQRADQLVFDEKNHLPARLPSSFRSQEFSLKPHQEYGIAWLQNLHQYAPKQVSGCLLADDMGLGKTLQLLCFIGE
ncbi:SNF2-related protein, partial [Acinetobacter baumannii]